MRKTVTYCDECKGECDDDVISFKGKIIKGIALRSYEKDYWNVRYDGMPKVYHFCKDTCFSKHIKKIMKHFALQKLSEKKDDEEKERVTDRRIRSVRPSGNISPSYGQMVKHMLGKGGV